MDNIKLSMTIVLPGRVIMSRKEARKNFKENYDHHSMLLKYEDKNGKYQTELIKFHTRKCIPATQVINMTQEAYNYMVSKEDKPEWFNSISDWKKLSNEQRLNLHLKRTCDAMGGSSYTYAVFND